MRDLLALTYGEDDSGGEEPLSQGWTGMTRAINTVLST